MTDDSETLRITEEAADWLLRLKADPDCQREFQAWLDRSPRHQTAWRTMLRSWELMGETTPRHAPFPPGAASAARTLRPRRSVGRRMIAPILTAIAAALVLYLAGPQIVLMLEADVRTATAESRTVTLADGSRVELGGGSAIGIDMADGRRSIRLLSGEAFFDVAHDPSRPFTVEAEGSRVVVLGTAFDVSIDPETTAVQLARGAVEVTGGTGTIRMTPGDMASVDRQTGEITRSTVAVEDVGAWRKGQLFVEDVTIDSVVARLQRYHPAWIGIADRGLGQRRVTGLYDLSDPDRALEALVRPHGGKVRAVSGYVRILSRY